VQVADYPGVRVLLENQPVGRTNASGFAVLPDLRAYDRNIISIDQTDLPMGAQVDHLSLAAAPYFRTGVLIDFPVKHVHAATLRIVLEDGRDMPSGAQATIIGGDLEEFPVALRGELYLTGLSGSQRVRIEWKNRSCVVDVAYRAGFDPLPDLGTFVCKGVLP
jgi:outer membrane usher protein